jgi:hypothetical protein
MFQVKPGTPIRVIRKQREWTAPNIREHITRKMNYFEKEEMIVDPAGIRRTDCCVPVGVTIGAEYAKAGWYGFSPDGDYVVLVHSQYVQYVD